MTSDQEAVCGTCGGRIRRVGVGSNPGTLRGALVCENGHAIPAPVVPSDDAPRREQYATSDEYRAATVEWALSAHPTPSQDAEGDGHVVEGYHWIETECCIVCDEPVVSADGRGWVHRARTESSIRADCEDLVTALHGEFDDLVLACRAVDTASATPGMIQETIDAITRMSAVLKQITGKPSSAYNTTDAALTHIEESLGGRKDG